MAVFSRLATVFAVSSLLLAVSPVAADSNALSHNKHPQARAAHHNHVGKRSSKKRGPAKRQGKCKPKATSTSVSTPAPTPTGKKDEDNNDDGKGDDNNDNGGDNGDNNDDNNSGGGGSAPVGGSKVGLGWNNEPDLMRQFVGSKSAVSWCYSWSPWNPLPKDLQDNVDFCPMMWGAKQEGDWYKTLEANKNVKCVLGMNEPDRHDQGAIDPWAAADLWRRTVEKLPSSARRVSPAPAGGEEGFTWLHNFIKACSDCQVDAIGAHIYTTNIENFKKYLTRVHNEYGKPVWVTEWACMDFSKGQGSCTKDQAFAFNNAAIDWMNSQGWIEKFAAFGSLRDMYNVDQDDRLMSGDGAITDLGWDYIRIRY